MDAPAVVVHLHSSSSCQSGQSPYVAVRSLSHDSTLAHATPVCIRRTGTSGSQQQSAPRQSAESPPVSQPSAPCVCGQSISEEVRGAFLPEEEERERGGAESDQAMAARLQAEEEGILPPKPLLEASPETHQCGPCILLPC